MVGSSEKKTKFGWMTFAWKLLEWEVEMYLVDLEQWFDISAIILYFHAKKIKQTKVKLVFLLLMLVELKLISMLLMPQTICEDVGDID